MHFIVKLFPEITVKSPPVRKQLTRQLRDNLRILTANLNMGIRVESDWDRLHLRCENPPAGAEKSITDILERTPGIANYAEVHTFALTSLEGIATQLLCHWRDALQGKTFCVRVKRVGNHDFTSVEAEQFLGGGLLHGSDSAGVNLSSPDITVRLEIRKDQVILLKNKTDGLGGFPLGSQEAVLSLVSGGFDSTIASYLTTRRGLKTHFCFFNLGGRAHEIAVKEIAFYLWNRFGSTHPVKFISVPFDDVVTEILHKISDPYMGVVLKRMMLRAAQQVANELGVQALVTGESVAQVSSQTLPNLAVIDRACDKLVMRPLILMHKGEIIDIARAIGAEEFAAQVPEYCAVISRNPSTRARLAAVEEVESSFNFDLLTDAVARRITQPIMAVMDSAQQVHQIQTTSEPAADASVIDIRHPNESELTPLQVEGCEVLCLPFYRLASAISDLDPQRQYWLYCDKGVMSRLQADTLLGNGFANVGVYLKPH